MPDCAEPAVGLCPFASFALSQASGFRSLVPLDNKYLGAFFINFYFPKRRKRELGAGKH